MFSLCRNVFGLVGLVPGRVQRCRYTVGTCSAKSGYSLDEFGDFEVVSELVR